DQVRREGMMIENTIRILFALVSEEEDDLEGVEEEDDLEGVEPIARVIAEPIARVASMLWMGVRAWYLRRGAQIAEATQVMHEESAMGEQQRQAKAAQAQAQLAAWDTITTSIKSIAVTLKSLEQSFGTL